MNIKRIFAVLVMVKLCTAVEFVNYGNWGHTWDIVAYNDTIFAGGFGAFYWNAYTVNDSFSEYYGGISTHEFVNGDIYAIAIDSSGAKWFGGSEVNVYDGESWITYTSQENDFPIDVQNSPITIQTIAIDTNNIAWLGTLGGGLVSYDGNSWTTYDTSNSGLTSNYINDIIIDRSNTKWIATNGGISGFDGETWTTYDTSDGINHPVEAIAIDSSGRLWCGTLGGGMMMYDGHTWTSYNSGSAPSFIHEIAIDHRGTIWTDGCSFRPPNNWNCGWFDGFYVEEVPCVAVDKYNNKWFGTAWMSVSKLVDSSVGVVHTPERDVATKPSCNVRCTGSGIMLTYTCTTPADAALMLYTTQGECVRHVSLSQETGRHTRMLSTKGLANGSYILRFRDGARVQHKRISLVR